MLVSYVRDEKGNPVATIVAIAKYCVGWSICHPNDKFQKRFGVEIARQRAIKNRNCPQPPNRKNMSKKLMLVQITKMLERSEKYFK
jgi:hypothetical protein